MDFSTNLGIFSNQFEDHLVGAILSVMMSTAVVCVVDVVRLSYGKHLPEDELKGTRLIPRSWSRSGNEP